MELDIFYQNISRLISPSLKQEALRRHSVKTAFRNGAKRVMLYARGKRISASEDEVMVTRLGGAEFVFEKTIQCFTDEEPVFQTSVPDEDDHVIGYEGGKE